MSRQYHSRKHNPTFTRSIITIRCMTKEEINPFNMNIYKWPSAKKGPCIVPRHGNASKPQARQYYRKDPQFSKEVDKQLASGLSTDQVYNNLSKARAETVCETISGPKFVDNRKFAVKPEHSNEERNDTRSSEKEQLISSLQSNPLVSSVDLPKSNIYQLIVLSIYSRIFIVSVSLETQCYKLILLLNLLIISGKQIRPFTMKLC